MPNSEVNRNARTNAYLVLLAGNGRLANVQNLPPGGQTKEAPLYSLVAGTWFVRLLGAGDRRCPDRVVSAAFEQVNGCGSRPAHARRARGPLAAHRLPRGPARSCPRLVIQAVVGAPHVDV